MNTEEFPEHIKGELRKLKEREENERKQREIDRSTCKVSFMNANEKLLRQYMYVTFCFDKKNLINAEQ
jgi:hypothetical protein